ncbi:glycosyltransferase family 32 protein [Acuticoccus sp. I52.16.1]|uniref:glycosyltransferase family 32 protein n=1 Tax=Acuticoccus sp. I52.16.1 TaxID=2928472 RepID=UPI001FCFB28B|nr:glycosyltransferase [Acuticoccus sp. I52.16.1]UOM37207.1 hypothetical protein MRB58_23890 [Acuticoccus sp. I52.16.1]
MIAHNLFQFWNSPEPPAEVAALMDTWKADPDFVYRRFTEADAEAYIAQRFEARTLAAYRACAIPAMQADLFRYCALYEEGGVYVDADSENGGNLAGFIADAPRGMLMTREVRIANDFLFVRAARDPLYEKVIRQAVENIEQRISNNVWAVTGPAIMTRMYRTPEQRPWFDGFVVHPVQEVRKIVQFRHKLAYKSTGVDWRAGLAEGAASIFVDAPPPR